MTGIAAPFRRLGPATRGVLALLVAAVLPGACTFASDVEVIEIAGSGNLIGQVYVDRDANGVLSEGDAPIVGAEVTLSSSPDGSVVGSTLSSGAGLFVFESVPVGSYRLSLDPGVLGDSLVLVGGGIFDMTNDQNLVANIGGTYPTLSVPEVLAARPGLRVVTSGIALNPRLNFDDGQVHFVGNPNAYLRTLGVGRVGIATGDSVRLVGRRIVDNGRPALDSVTATLVLSEAALVAPVETRAGIAANAGGGSLDAALVVVRNVAVSDTSTSATGDFHFVATDVTGSLEVVIRSFLALSGPDIPTTSITRLIGLLSPYDDGSGTVRWRLLPRSADDITP